MSALAVPDSRELATLAGLTGRGPYQHDVERSRSKADSIIVIHLGPGQTPEVARILRSEWPTVTALNPGIGPEFHVRMRRHARTGVCLIYASVDVRQCRGKASIFAEVVQRGRVVKTPQQIQTAIAEIRAELGITKPGQLGP